MCIKSNTFVNLSLLFGALQSVVWAGICIVCSLIYLCVIPISPYKDSGDFIRVTSVKLYFEGPECKLDGSYLGKFNDDYRNPAVIKLFTPDKVFAVMIAYTLLNAVYFISSLSTWFAWKLKSSTRVSNFSSFGYWGFLTLFISGVDAFLTTKFIFDIISIKNYMNDKDEHAEVSASSAHVNLSELPYIPLLLAIVSNKFIGIWLWNVIVGLVFFLSALCGKKHVKVSLKNGKNTNTASQYEELESSNKNYSASMLKNGYNDSFEIRPSSDYPSIKSMEAVTRFNEAPKTIYSTSNGFESHINWTHNQEDSYWSNLKAHSSKDNMEMTNDGFVDDDEDDTEDFQETPDFDQKLKNFEQGQRKIRIVKPPLGKPVKNEMDEEKQTA